MPADNVIDLDEARRRRWAFSVGLVLLIVGAGVLVWAVREKKTEA